MTLQQDGIECDVARTAREARAMIERRPYAALTLDLHVPDLEGFTLVRDLREREIETPVVIVSGHAGSDELDARLRGVIDWLTERPVPERSEESAQSRPPRPERVLYVEDDAHDGAIAGGALRGLGALFDACSVEEAREGLGEAEPDLVVLDSALPHGAALALLPLFGARNIPVVVFSAAESTLEPRSPEAALVKPRVTNEALRETILRALGRPVPGS